MIEAPTILLSLVSAVAVDATYSIVASDARTRRVGGAGATCIPSADVYGALYFSAPNRSVLHSQGYLYEREDILTAAVEMMKRGESIGDTLAKAKELDAGRTLNGQPLAELRQFGMADFNDGGGQFSSSPRSHGGYTGKSLAEVYESMGILNTEQVDGGADRRDGRRYSFHAQGNVVAAGTVAGMRDGFLLADEDESDDMYSCDVAGRLMSSMVRVAEGGLGDMRCIDDHGGVSATGAFLHVDNPDGTEWIHVNEVGDGSYEPVEEVRQRFLEWRKSHPCPGGIGNETSVWTIVNGTDPSPDETDAHISSPESPDSNSGSSRSTAYIGNLAIFGFAFIFTKRNIA